MIYNIMQLQRGEVKILLFRAMLLYNGVQPLVFETHHLNYLIIRVTNPVATVRPPSLCYIISQVCSIALGLVSLDEMYLPDVEALTWLECNRIMELTLHLNVITGHDHL
jgi:hypothetical protein